MTTHDTFHHSLAVDADRCAGCAHCIRRCPTKALRIRGGKAALRKDWCIDCGECLKACPAGAIYVEQDDFDEILRYPCRAVLYPAAFLAQFPEQRSEDEILAALRTVGFTHAFPVELSVGYVRARMAEAIASNADKPIISPLCPAVVRLIQTKFPDLTHHILNLRTPLEATALLCRRRLEAEGRPAADIGLFYVTPCAAKAAAGLSDRNGEHLIDGVLNLDSLYNKVCRILGNRGADAQPTEATLRLPRWSMSWSLASGEASAFGGRCLSVDGIDHVKEFLERTEATGSLHEIDFLELRACHRGCVGGSLTPVNRFLTEERLRRRIDLHPAEESLAAEPSEAEGRFLDARMPVAETAPMTKLLFRGSIAEVLRCMDEARTIRRTLPGLDCGACGSPTCESLSHDIVRGEAHASDCIFVHLAADRREGDAMRQLERVWGPERFRRRPKQNE